MERDALIEHVSTDLLAYVMHGEIAEQNVFSKIKPDELDERFEDFEALVDLHFLLREDVVAFVRELPTRLRSIKTQTQNRQRTTRGAVSGRIDWEKTAKTRWSKAPKDRSLFVCDNRYESYDIDENIVLRRLLSVIYHTLDRCEQYLKAQYGWVTDRWQENLELVDQIRTLFERNVHISRIREPESYEPTDRMLETATQARNEIYREAAELLEEYRRSQNGDKAALRELLQATTITPDDEETLFELYVLFRYVEAIETRQDGKTTVSTIASGRQEVARIESPDDADVVLYHDTAAGNRKLSFIPEAMEKTDAELTRMERIKRESRSIVEQYFTDIRSRQQTNRPDVIVLEIQRDYQYEYLITEVKYSSNPETIEQGVVETLEYLAFLRRDNQLVFEAEEPFGNGWNGVLVVQDITEHETSTLTEQETIRIVQASELDDFLPEILEKAL